VSSGTCDADYAWHPQARVWQTTRLGEASCDTWLGMTDAEQIDALVASGMPSDWAEHAAPRIDDRMLRAVLALYRSEPYTGDWQLTTSRTYPPGLVLWGSRDPYASSSLGKRIATRGQVRFAELDGGHWWPIEQPAQGAALLRELLHDRSAPHTHRWRARLPR
jgi:pimeloyl-ACP methyl ester carboxylesterase